MSEGEFHAAPADDARVAELETIQPDNPFATRAYADSRRRVGYATWVLGLRGGDGRVMLGCLGLLSTGRLNRTLESTVEPDTAWNSSPAPDSRKAR